MKKEKIVALVLAVVGMAVFAVLKSDEGCVLITWFGKAVWYIPYAALVSSVKYYHAGCVR